MADNRINNSAFPIVTLGDSHANGMGRILQNYYTHTTNLGKDGRHITDLSPAILKQVPPSSIVIISMGANDVSSMLSGQIDAVAYAQRLVAMANELRSKGCVVVIAGPQTLEHPYTENVKNTQPSTWNPVAERLNSLLQEECNLADVLFFSSESIPRHLRATDNLHYTQDGYKSMLLNISQLINQRYGGKSLTSSLSQDGTTFSLLPELPDGPLGSVFRTAGITQPQNSVNTPTIKPSLPENNLA